MIDRTKGFWISKGNFDITVLAGLLRIKANSKIVFYFLNSQIKIQETKY